MDGELIIEEHPLYSIWNLESGIWNLILFPPLDFPSYLK